MSSDPDTPSSSRQEHPRRTLAGGYRGFITFGVLNFLAFLVMNDAIGARRSLYTALAGVGLLAVVIALAAWAYFGWGRPGFAAGLLGGYALMTIISGGTCTLFVSNSLDSRFNVITGLLLYIGAVVIFGLVLLIRRLSQSGWI